MKKVLSTIIFISLACVGFALTTMFPPTLVAPINSVTNQMPNTFMNWNAVPGAFSYKVQICADSNFIVSPKNYSTTLTALTTSNLHFDTKYFWRVKAIGVNDSSAWSTLGKFFSIPTVTITKPDNGSTNRNVSAYFKWNVISGLTHYEYQLDSSNTFSSPLLVTGIISPLKSDAMSKQLAFGTHYFLRMRAAHADDTSAWSALTDFTTLADLANLTPADNETTRYTPITTLEWNWVGASYYDYSISVDTSFTSPMLLSCDTSKMVKLALDTIIRANTETLLFGQKYYWKVRARNIWGTSNWSHFTSFTTLYNFGLFTPANNSFNVPLAATFTWDSIKNVDYFILEVADNFPFTGAKSFVIPSNMYTYTLGTADHLLYDKDYWWRMRTSTGVDTSYWSNTYKFRSAFGVGIETTSGIDNNSVAIYPNPSFNGKVNLQITSSNNQEVKLSLINMVGQEVYKQQLDVTVGSNSFSLDLNNNDNGIYFLKIYNNDNTLTRKIILNK